MEGEPEPLTHLDLLSFKSHGDKSKKIVDWLLMRNIPQSNNYLNNSPYISAPSLNPSLRSFTSSNSSEMSNPNLLATQNLAREAFARTILDPNARAEMKAFDKRYSRVFDLYEQYINLEGSLPDPKTKSGLFKSKKSDKLVYPAHILRFFNNSRMDLTLYGVKGEIPVAPEVPTSVVSNFLVFHESYLSANAPALPSVSDQTRRNIADQLVFGSGNKITLNVFDPVIDQIMNIIFKEVYQPWSGPKTPSQAVTRTSESANGSYSSPVNSRPTSPSVESLPQSSARSSTSNLTPSESSDRLSARKVPTPTPASAAPPQIISAEQFDPEIAHNRESFVRVLDDVIFYAEFQQFCEVDFCLENFLFLEGFTKLEQMLSESVTKYGSTHKSRARFQASEKYVGALKSSLVRRFLGYEQLITAADPSRDSISSTPTSSSATSPVQGGNGPSTPNRGSSVAVASPGMSPAAIAAIAQSLPSNASPDGHPAGYVPIWLVSHFLMFFDTYIATGSLHEVNIPGTMRKRITDTLVAGGAYRIPTTVFDEAADEVIRMLYLNTYARFVQMKRGAPQTPQRDRGK